MNFDREYLCYTWMNELQTMSMYIKIYCKSKTGNLKIVNVAGADLSRKLFELQ